MFSCLLWCFYFVIHRHLVGTLGQLTYDEDLARRLVHFTGAVYCVDDEAFGDAFEDLIENFECETCDYITETSSIDEVYAFQDDSIWIDTEGMVTYDSLNNAITVVFAGTDPTEVADVFTDLELIRVEYPPCGGKYWWSDDCTVHKGFYKAYLSVDDTVYDIVKYLTDTYTDATLEITGHSLGGAMAILCALDLYENHGTSIVADYVYTFGMPRVGDDEFAEYYDSIFGDKTIRVTHRKDPVPLVPWKSWGWNYLHFKQEVYYPDDADGDVCVFMFSFFIFLLIQYVLIVLCFVWRLVFAWRFFFFACLFSFVLNL